MSFSKSERPVMAAIFLAGALLLLPGTEGLNLLRQGDEVMHIATVRESLDTDSILLPRLTGQPNAYKPPLLFWMGMAGEWLLGRSLFADRFVVALLGAGTAVFVYGLVRLHRLSTRRSLAVALGFLFSLAAFKFGRLLMMDLPMAFFLTAVAWASVKHWRSPRGRMNYLILAGFLTGIAFLYKGPLFHAYAALLLLAQAGMRLWSPAMLSQFRRWKARLLQYVKEALVFVLASLVVPAAWVLVLYGNGLGDVLWFFFVVENIGKFAADNQPMMRIFGGWLLYLLPFTLPVLWIAIDSFRRPVKAPSAYTARIFFLAAILITCLHLLPDRKDPYYVVPVLPAVIVAAGLVWRSDRLSLRLLTWQSAFMALLLAVALFLFADLWIAIVASSVLLLAVVAGWMSTRKIAEPKLPGADEAGGMLWRTLAAPLLIMAILQFVLLPAVTRPILPEAYVPALKKTGVCLVSRNWWDVFELQLYLPDTEIQHSSPADTIFCADRTKAVLALQEDMPVPEGYEEAASWSHWSIRPVAVGDVMARSSSEGWRQALEGRTTLHLPFGGRP